MSTDPKLKSKLNYKVARLEMVRVETHMQQKMLM